MGQENSWGFYNCYTLTLYQLSRLENLVTNTSHTRERAVPETEMTFPFIQRSHPRGGILFARGARIVPFIEFVPTFALISFSVLNNRVLSSKIHFGCECGGLMTLVSDSSGSILSCFRGPEINKSVIWFGAGGGGGFSFLSWCASRNFGET